MSMHGMFISTFQKLDSFFKDENWILFQKRIRNKNITSEKMFHLNLDREFPNSITYHENEKQEANLRAILLPNLLVKLRVTD